MGFVELRFRSVAQARRRALMVFLCTFSARDRTAVPLVTRQMLQSTEVAKTVLRLWDIYGLTWENGDRASIFQLRNRYARNTVEIVPFCGREPWHVINNRDWLANDGRRVTSNEHGPRGPPESSGKALLPPAQQTGTSRPATRQSLTSSKGTSLPPIQGVQGAKESVSARCGSKDRPGSLGNPARQKRQNGALTARESSATPRGGPRKNRGTAQAKSNGYPDM